MYAVRWDVLERERCSPVSYIGHIRGVVHKLLRSFSEKRLAATEGEKHSKVFRRRQGVYSQAMRCVSGIITLPVNAPEKRYRKMFGELEMQTLLQGTASGLVLANFKRFRVRVQYNKCARR